VQNFLTLHPHWTDRDFDNILIPDLQNRGYGHLHPQGVKSILTDKIPQTCNYFEV
jgi:hypothetical protein